MSKNKTPKKILVTTDASFLCTGYGVYAKEILSRFHQSEEYDVAELSCYATIEDIKNHNIPWKAYANAVSSKDARFSAYKNNTINQFGAWRFDSVLCDYQPDIVITWTDYWMYSYQEMSPLRRFFNWVQMPMVDSAPQKIEWLYTYCNSDYIIPYTKWAKKILQESCGDLINLFDAPANAGVNPHEFYPVEDKIAHKTKYFGKNINVIGTVMRNQKRKLFADLLLVFRNYLNLLADRNLIEEYNNTFLYFHTSYPEETGWDFPALLIEYDLLDKVYFTYFCKNCKTFYPLKFQGPTTYCSSCNSRSCCFPSPSAALTSESLNSVYNLFDFYIQYAIAEGFGIPAIEAASCGIPFASVDYSAMTEIAENLQGIKIPVKRFFRELETNADRAYPDNDATLEIIDNFFNKTSMPEKVEMSKNIRKLCSSIYNWDNTYNVWKNCLDLLAKPAQRWSINNNYSPNLSASVSNELDNRLFVDFICREILKDPEIINTAPVQNMIKDMFDLLVAKNGIMQTFERNNAVKGLEGYIKTKINAENRRSSRDVSKEDYLL
jgi:glycosyltransferase involved in cell wall biosynthesis